MRDAVHAAGRSGLAVGPCSDAGAAAQCTPWVVAAALYYFLALNEKGSSECRPTQCEACVLFV